MSRVRIDKHAPERRRPSGGTCLHCGCSCCCCCCCLHSVGGLIGAGIAPAIGGGSRPRLGAYYDEDDLTAAIRRPPGLSAVALFWWVFLGLLAAGFCLGVASDRGSPTSVIVTAIILLLVMPGLQLASAAVTAVVMALWPRPDKVYQLAQLGKAVLGLIAGTLLGVVGMAAMAAPFLVKR